MAVPDGALVAMAVSLAWQAAVGSGTGTRMAAENDSLASGTLLVRRGRRISLAP
jgi:hypothetical protein